MVLEEEVWDDVDGAEVSLCIEEDVAAWKEKK